MGMAAEADPRVVIQTSLRSDPESRALTNLTVLPGEALVTATAIHGAVGFTGAPMQARVVLAGIQGGCRTTGSVERRQATMSSAFLEFRPKIPQNPLCGVPSITSNRWLQLSVSSCMLL